MTQRRLNLVARVPVPVGHRIRVTWFEVDKVSGGLLAHKKTKTERIASPMIVDLDTGIRYAALIHFLDKSLLEEARQQIEAHTPRDLRVTEEITGTVRACSVVDVRFEGSQTSHYETELLLELEAT